MIFLQGLEKVQATVQTWLKSSWNQLKQTSNKSGARPHRRTAKVGPNRVWRHCRPAAQSSAGKKLTDRFCGRQRSTKKREALRHKKRLRKSAAQGSRCPPGGNASVWKRQTDRKDSRWWWGGGRIQEGFLLRFFTLDRDGFNLRIHFITVRQNFATTLNIQAQIHKNPPKRNKKKSK